MSTKNINKNFTYECDTRVLASLTGLSKGERASRVEWLLKQGECVLVEAVRLQQCLFQEYLNEERAKNLPKADRLSERHKAELLYGLLVAAVMHMQASEKLLKTRGAKAEEMAEISMQRFARIRADKRAKRAPAREKFRVGFYLLVKDLREVKGATWREIETYLARYHSTKWQYSWIQSTYTKINNEQPSAIGKP